MTETDIEVMMTKVDMHKYNCAREFLDDVDHICANALEYNPDRDRYRDVKETDIETKVDMHKYNCAREFLDDVDLICANALEYNPDRTSSDKQIRHEACSLRDHAHALIDVEMDSDFELECQDIARKRQDEGMKSDTDVPDFIYTASNLREYFLLDGFVCFYGS
ncbi:unnamed protein product [Plutella xylostella]|uniref:(diamondback moth) hypothetical protein n=1 Tax=Plutella xylostella TaxID=51655 RepID=A0A8S4E976_PLUXY|nr:unnamed protein product [Plutella xylostella]